MDGKNGCASRRCPEGGDSYRPIPSPDEAGLAKVVTYDLCSREFNMETTV